MQDIIIYIISNILTKILRILKIIYNIGVLKDKHDEFYIVLDLFSFIRYLFINNEFSYILSNFYKKYGNPFKKWFLKTYGILIGILNILIFVFGKYLFNLFHLPINKLPNFIFFIRGLSFLTISMFFLGAFKGFLYSEKNLKFISIAVPISSLCMILVLSSVKYLSIPVVLVLSQLVYASVQAVIYAISMKGIKSVNDFKEFSVNTFVFHKEMLLLCCNALLMVGMRIINNRILSKYKGRLSISKYIDNIIWTIIGFISGPIVDFALIKLQDNKKTNTETIKESLIKGHKINIYVTLLFILILRFIVFFGGVLGLSFIQKLRDFQSFIIINSLVIYPAIQNRLLKVIGTVNNKNKHSFYSNVIQSLGQIGLILFLGKFTNIPLYLTPVIASMISSYMQTILLYSVYFQYIKPLLKEYLIHTGVFLMILVFNLKI